VSRHDLPTSEAMALEALPYLPDGDGRLVDMATRAQTRDHARTWYAAGVAAERARMGREVAVLEGQAHQREDGRWELIVGEHRRRVDIDELADTHEFFGAIGRAEGKRVRFALFLVDEAGGGA
jgi:hypothetical protein